jgi:uncharacterized protein YcbX
VIGTITAIGTTPVKGLRLQRRTEVMLTEAGAADDRRFFVIDRQDRMVNNKRIGRLMAVVADYDPRDTRLTLTFPDGTSVASETRDGEPVEATFFSLRPTTVLVPGPFSEALSDYAGESLRLARIDPRRGGIDRGPAAGVSLISEASVQRLAGLAGQSVDSRRFRMTFEVAGLEAHQEDALVGSEVRIGEALVAFGGNVGRCLVTGLSPETGTVDLPTLALLDYRNGVDTTEPLPFGVYGRVLEPGRVRLGDALTATDVPARSGT